MAFDFNNLLDTIGDAGDRQSFSEIAAKYPAIQDYLADPEDKALVDSVQKWRTDNWDDEHGMTRNEFAHSQRIQQLQAALDAAPTGEGMNLEELDKYLETQITSGKLVSPEMVRKEFTGILTEKEKGYNQLINEQMNVYTDTAVRIPFLMMKHEKEFGELLDPNQILRDAAEKKMGLDQYYESIAGPKRAEAQAKKHTAELEAARAEGRKAAIEERVTNPQTGQSPTIDGDPQVGHFQAKLMGEKSEKASAVPESAQLGDGLIARTAARAGDRAEMLGSAA
jgi:hypothetical protein